MRSNLANLTSVNHACFTRVSAWSCSQTAATKEQRCQEASGRDSGAVFCKQLAEIRKVVCRTRPLLGTGDSGGFETGPAGRRMVSPYGEHGGSRHRRDASCAVAGRTCALRPVLFRARPAGFCGRAHPLTQGAQFGWRPSADQLAI